MSSDGYTLPGMVMPTEEDMKSLSDEDRYKIRQQVRANANNAKIDAQFSAQRAQEAQMKAVAAEALGNFEEAKKYEKLAEDEIKGIEVSNLMVQLNIKVDHEESISRIEDVEERKKVLSDYSMQEAQLKANNDFALSQVQTDYQQFVEQSERRQEAAYQKIQEKEAEAQREAEAKRARDEETERIEAVEKNLDEERKAQAREAEDLNIKQQSLEDDNMRQEEIVRKKTEEFDKKREEINSDYDDKESSAKADLEARKISLEEEKQKQEFSEKIVDLGAEYKKSLDTAKTTTGKSARRDANKAAEDAKANFKKAYDGLERPTAEKNTLKTLSAEDTKPGLDLLATIKSEIQANIGNLEAEITKIEGVLTGFGEARKAELAKVNQEQEEFNARMQKIIDANKSLGEEYQNEIEKNAEEALRIAEASNNLLADRTKLEEEECEIEALRVKKEADIIREEEDAKRAARESAEEAIRGTLKKSTERQNTSDKDAINNSSYMTNAMAPHQARGALDECINSIEGLFPRYKEAVDKRAKYVAENQAAQSVKVTTEDSEQPFGDPFLTKRLSTLQSIANSVLEETDDEETGTKVAWEESSSLEDKLSPEEKEAYGIEEAIGKILTKYQNDTNFVVHHLESLNDANTIFASISEEEDLEDLANLLNTHFGVNISHEYLSLSEFTALTADGIDPGQFVFGVMNYVKNARDLECEALIAKQIAALGDSSELAVE